MIDESDDRITVLAREYNPAAMEFHRRAVSGRGYALEGQIVPQKFLILDGPGAPTELFDGELFYAVRFVRRDAGED